MSRTPASREFLLALSILLLLVPGARGDTPGRARVTIRGTGSNVTIERTQGPVVNRPADTAAVTAAVPAEALGNAIRLKSQGATDAAVVSYLRAHAAEIPPVVDAAEIRRLRQAGAGRAVVASLATMAAVDIGETGEGRETVASSEPLQEIEGETPGYGVPYGYPIAGGSVAPHAGRRHGSVSSLRRAPFPLGQPVLRRSFPSHGMRGRPPIE